MIPSVQLEWITWKDAVGSSSRAQADGLKQVTLAINTNIGWVAHETDELVVLAHGISDTGEVDHFAIPKSCIVERVRTGRRKKPPLPRVTAV